MRHLIVLTGVLVMAIGCGEGDKTSPKEAMAPKAPQAALPQENTPLNPPVAEEEPMVPETPNPVVDNSPTVGDTSNETPEKKADNAGMTAAKKAIDSFIPSFADNTIKKSSTLTKAMTSLLDPSSLAGKIALPTIKAALKPQVDKLLKEKKLDRVQEKYGDELFDYALEVLKKQFKPNP